MNRPIYTKRDESAWWYMLDGDHEAVRAAFAPPTAALVKEARRQTKVRLAKFCAIISIFLGVVYALSSCEAQAQSMLPSQESNDPVGPLNQLENLESQKRDVAMLPLQVIQIPYDRVITAMMACRGGIMPRDAVVNGLRAEHGELHERTVYLDPTAVAELFINRDTGTWTILRTGPRNQACSVAGGVHSFRPEESAL
jgi:hypothetical protein